MYIYIYRYIETVTSLPDRQCPEQGRCFFVVQDFVLGVIYIYIYLYTRTLSLECIYAYIYIYIQSPPAAAAAAASKSTSRHQNSKARKDEHATESHRKSA